MANVGVAAGARSTRGVGALGVGATRARREAVWGYAMIAPLMLLFGVFWLVPVLAVFAIGLTRWDLFTAPEFVGLRNFELLLQDPVFARTLQNTAVLTLLFVPAALALSLGLALALNTHVPFRGLYRAIYFLPVLTLPAANATVWRWLYDPTFGPINAALGSVGLPRPAWLSDPALALPAVAAVLVWNYVGREMVLFLAGLQNIPQDYYEAAQIDGAGRWAQFRHVTLPLLTPTTFFATVTLLIWSLQVFDVVFVMTQGGPANATRTIVYYLYDEAFRNFRMGYASAIASVLFVLTLLFTLLQFRLQRRWVHYG